MKILNTVFTLVVASLCAAGCGGGGGGSTANQALDDTNDLLSSSPALSSDALQSPATDVTLNEEQNTGVVSDLKARFRVTLENRWGVGDFPQGFPDDAHLSLIGGATHSVAVSFWEPGDIVSPGIEDVAEAGLIDKLLFEEVAPAIANGTADAMIEVREFTDPQINGVPGELKFTINMNLDYPLVSMVSMLGPSPDWFVGVSGLSLRSEGNWVTQLSVELPMYDGGTKSDITPIMGGPDIIPPNAIGLVAYDAQTGVYLPSEEPQNVARLTFERIDL